MHVQFLNIYPRPISIPSSLPHPSPNASVQPGQHKTRRGRDDEWDGGGLEDGGVGSAGGRTMHVFWKRCSPPTLGPEKNKSKIKTHGRHRDQRKTIKKQMNTKETSNPGTRIVRFKTKSSFPKVWASAAKMLPALNQRLSPNRSGQVL